MLVARVIAMMRVMVRRIVTSVSITRVNGLWGSTLCSVLSLIYPVFTAPLQGIGTMVHSVEMATKDRLSSQDRGLVCEAQIHR